MRGFFVQLMTKAIAKLRSKQNSILMFLTSFPKRNMNWIKIWSPQWPTSQRIFFQRSSFTNLRCASSPRRKLWQNVAWPRKPQSYGQERRYWRPWNWNDWRQSQKSQNHRKASKSWGYLFDFDITNSLSYFWTFFWPREQ